MGQGRAGDYRGSAGGGAAAALPLSDGAVGRTALKTGPHWRYTFISAAALALAPAANEGEAPRTCQCCASAATKRRPLGLYYAGVYDDCSHGTYRVARLPYWVCGACLDAWREVDALYSHHITWRKRVRGEVVTGGRPAA